MRRQDKVLQKKVKESLKGLIKECKNHVSDTCVAWRIKNELKNALDFVTHNID